MPFLSDFSVKIDGESLKGVMRVNIIQNIYEISRFELLIRFESAEQPNSFVIEKSRNYLNGKVVIQTQISEPGSTTSTDGLLFRGIITKVYGTKTDIADGNGIVLSGHSPEVLLNTKAHTRAFIDSSLKSIVDSVLKPYDQGLLKPKIDPRNKKKHAYIVQYEESDLDFIRRLSIRFGEWFYFNGSHLIFGEHEKNELDLAIGVDVNKFTYSLETNPVKFASKSYDFLNVKVHSFKSSQVNPGGDLNSYGKFALQKSNNQFPDSTIAFIDHWNQSETDVNETLKQAGELEVKADAVNLTGFSGSGTNPSITIGQVTTIRAVKDKEKGRIDYGKYLLTKVEHKFDHILNYNSEFAGTPKESSIPENTNPAIYKPAISHICEVMDNADPQKLGRVKVKYSWMPDDQLSPWLNVISAYVQKAAGFYFVPPVTSMVLINYEGGNIEKPFCVGSLFNKNSSPDTDWVGNYDGDNAKIHAIRTASGNTIEFHDDSSTQKICIYDTDKKNEIILDAAKGEVIIKATEKISLESKEIEINASKGVKIVAGKEIEQDAQDIIHSAKSKLENSALKIEIKAKTSLKAEGSASAQFSSGGINTIKGSIVKIN
jgi:type VI secretion system secreted protein VgrG